MNNAHSNKELYVYQCAICRQAVASRIPLHTPMSCHNAHMQLLQPGQTEASFDKHIPKYEIFGNNILVQVGEEPHPMEPSHHIEWIAIVTDCGVHIRFLNENGLPNASFTINSQETLKSVYEYCNIHGVWKSE